MAKRNYESKIAIQTKNFIGDKDKSTEEISAITPSDISEKTEQRVNKPAPKESTTKQKDNTQAPFVPDAEDIEDKVNSIIKSLIDSGKLLELTKNKKSGRPKKYEDETVLSSFRLTKTNYDFAYKMGRSDFASMTEYINHLIDQDRLSRS
ncbi:hypothetical protein [Butyrivibrio sp. YAB3001]|uniref:hypothetical protein n=1 Tax=Butyrivibrio sp. YAB3001 TaxID=1520812 RepID=UPI0008F6256E|nr:hypothetical protein [Butyrivibrio sp. YAB3001]SFD06135.1 hypothetical protein SAMN02910398_03934 [Butyrivibrio sp. YAB3001]